MSVCVSVCVYVCVQNELYVWLGQGVDMSLVLGLNVDFQIVVFSALDVVCTLSVPCVCPCLGPGMRLGLCLCLNVESIVCVARRGGARQRRRRRRRRMVQQY